VQQEKSNDWEKGKNAETMNFKSEKSRFLSEDRGDTTRMRKKRRTEREHPPKGQGWNWQRIIETEARVHCPWRHC